MNHIASYFNLSYKRGEDYSIFSQQYLNEKKLLDPSLYQDIKKYRKFQRYCDTRWLSLGESLKKLVEQWCCLNIFIKNQINDKKELKLTPKQMKFIESISMGLSSNTVKYLVSIYLHIFNDLNRVNRIFQSHSSKLHLIWTESKIILDESNDKWGF